MSEDAFHGQSTKEAYREDISDSLKQKTSYKLFEFLDDYSYGNSENMGVYLKNIKDKDNLILFSEDGPKDIKNLRKLLEWRRSGILTKSGIKVVAIREIFMVINRIKLI